MISYRQGIQLKKKMLRILTRAVTHILPYQIQAVSVTDPNFGVYEEKCNDQ
jgi:hypothetical protein